MKVAIVKSSDLKIRWGARAALADPTIPKYCVACRERMIQTNIVENGQKKEDVLFCPKCRKFYE